MKIERNVGVPEERKRVHVGPLPLSKLNVGDSIVVEFAPEELSKAAHTIRVRCCLFSNKDPKYKFSVKKETSKNRVRIWRIK
jgi:hypothetical protein